MENLGRRPRFARANSVRLRTRAALRISGEHRLPACCRRQLADDSSRYAGIPGSERSISFSAGCQKGQAGSLCSPEARQSGCSIAIYQSLITSHRSLGAYGRGPGVGRGLAVGSDLGVGVTRGVEVGVGVAVGVTVGVAVGVAVAVGVGVGVAPPGGDTRTK